MVTTNVDGAGVSAVPVGEPVELDGVRVTYFPSSFRRLYWSPSMRFHAEDYDVVHLHSVYLWPTHAAARAARQARVPYVISPRGMLVRELIERKSTLVKKAWLTLVERSNFEHAARIHFTSQREWDDARAVGLPLPSPFVVPNGIDLPPPRPTPRDDRLVLYLGRVNWKKGIDRLIDAMALLPDARLIVAGNDEENYLAQLPRSDRVTFAGPVGGEEKDELLRRASVLVLPSMSENFGNVVLEAMAVETPVVVTPGVGLAPDVAAAGAGLVSDGAPQPLAAAIASILNDRVTAEAMGRRGRALVESRFTWERVAAEMEEAYRCSIASRP